MLYLPEEVDRVLWLDSDVIVNGEIGEFYRQSFDGKMYVCLGNSNTFEDMKFDIYEIDLSSKKKNKIVNVAMGNATVVGSNLYYMPYNNNGGNRTLYRLNVTMPAYIEKVAVMPEEFSMLHNNFVSNGNNMYFQSSGARKIWQVYPNGAAKVLVEFNDENEYSSVNSQGIIAYKLSNINRLLPWEIDVLDANGKTTNYSDFLGEAYFIKGKADFDKIEGTLSTTFNEKNLDGVIAKPTQKYFNTDGDMVVELEVTNTTGDAIRISSFSFLTVCDDKKHSVQLNGGGEIGSGASAVYTFVMPKEIIGKNAHQKKTGFNFAFSIGRKN